MVSSKSDTAAGCLAGEWWRVGIVRGGVQKRELDYHLSAFRSLGDRSWAFFVAGVDAQFASWWCSRVRDQVSCRFWRENLWEAASSTASTAETCSNPKPGHHQKLPSSPGDLRLPVSRLSLQTNSTPSRVVRQTLLKRKLRPFGGGRRLSGIQPAAAQRQQGTSNCRKPAPLAGCFFLSL